MNETTYTSEQIAAAMKILGFNDSSIASVVEALQPESDAAFIARTGIIPLGSLAPGDILRLYKLAARNVG